MAKNRLKKAAKTPGPMPDFPRQRFPVAQRHVVFDQPVKDIRSAIWPIEQIISEGVLLESSARESDALACIAMLGTRVSYQHIRQLPSGRRVLVSARNGN